MKLNNLYRIFSWNLEFLVRDHQWFIILFVVTKLAFDSGARLPTQ